MLKIIKKEVLKIYPLYLLLLLYFIFALITYKDYGITLDEPRVYQRGHDLLQYYSQKTSYKNTIEPTYNLEPKKQRHSPLLSQYYNGYAALLTVFNKQMSFERYHFFNLVFASLLIVFSYLAVYKKYKDKFLATIIPLVIFLTPRFLGHIPANPKDMPFAVIYISALFIIYLVETSNFKLLKDPVVKALLLSFVFMLTQSTRIVGYSIYLIYGLFLLQKYFLIEQKRIKKQEIFYHLKIVFLIFIFSHFLEIITWPFLASNLINNLPVLFEQASSFEAWNKEFLFRGNLVNPETRPNNYLFVWLLTTTPVIFLLFMIIGLCLLSKKYRDPLFFLFLSSFALQTIIYLLVRPNVYNGLRHYLFYLVNLLVIAGLGLIELLNKSAAKMLKGILLATFLIAIFLNLANLKTLHPYQYIYFNGLSGDLKKAEGNFPLDYWGASYKEASDWIANEFNWQNEGDDKVKVYTCNSSFAVDYYGRETFELIANPNDADYLICQEKLEKFSPIFEVKRKNITINTVYKK